MQQTIIAMEINNWEVPLWKMKITNGQYEELKKELYDAFILPKHKNINSLAREAALFYAEWWRREYCGGSTKIQSLTNSLSLPTNYSDELFRLANKGGEILKIPIVGHKNRLWFRSLLMQGGLPMNHIQSNSENITVYRNFLKGLIQHTENVNVNWNDSSFIENLPYTNYLPLSFKNKDIYELSLLIARAIYEKNDDLLPYDAQEGKWKELTDDLKASANNEISHSAPFVVRWKILKSDNNLHLSFHVELAKKISNSYKKEYKLEDCNSISLYVQNQYVATYARTLTGDFIFRESKLMNFKWTGEPVILLQLKKDNSEIIDITAPNCFVPDFENPQLIVENEGFWFFKSGTSNSNKNAVLFPSGWHNNESAEEIYLKNIKLYWFEFSESITIKNGETDEEITFDNSSTQYSCEFAGWSIDWVQNANYKILSSKPDIRLYDGSHIRVATTPSIHFREYRQREWTKYNGNNLPIGLLEFRIDLPDKKYFKEKFYYTGKLDCIFQNLTQKSGEIKWDWPGGNIFPLADQTGLEIKNIDNNLWRVTHKSDLKHYPDITKFRLFPKSNGANSPFLEISVASPFSGIVLLNSQGVEIDNEQVLCRSSLYGYRYVVMGQTVNTEISHFQNPSVIINGQLEKGIHSLSRFEDNIRDMFQLYDSNPFNIESKVIIKIGKKSIFIKEFNLFSKKNEENNSIFIIDNYENNNNINYQAKLFGIALECSSEEIIVEELEKNPQGIFSLKEETSLSKFILFSDKNADEKIVPRYFDFSNDIIDQQVLEDDGLSPQERNILKIKNRLEKSLAFDNSFQISEEWAKVIKYYNIVIEYSLPFKTLNCFRAIAQNPLLMVKMTYLLWQSNSVNKDNLLYGLSRFENELAVAWHWIKEKDWEDGMDWLLDNMPEILIQGFLKSSFEMKKSLINYTLNSETGELLSLLENDNGQNMLNIAAPLPPRIQEIRAKLGGNENLPNNLVFIPDEWKKLFPAAMNNQLPIYVRALLIAPVKAALSMTSKDDSIWNENSKMRRTINFYRQLLPSEYYELLSCMVKRTLQTNNIK